MLFDNPEILKMQQATWTSSTNPKKQPSTCGFRLVGVSQDPGKNSLWSPVNVQSKVPQCHRLAGKSVAFWPRVFDRTVDL